MRLNNYSSPLQLFLITALAVYLGEVVVMFLLSVLPALPMVIEAFVDALMLTALATPFLYLFLFRPMVAHIRERRRAEESLLKVNEALEHRVADRTAELSSANEQLKREIEERERARADLVKTNKFIQSVIESAPSILLIYDVSTLRCIYVNERIEDLLGYTPEDVCVQGDHFFRGVLGPREYDSFTKLNERIAIGEHGDVKRQLFSLKHAGGDFRRFSVNLVVLSRTESGDPKEILLSAIEIDTILSNFSN